MITRNWVLQNTSIIITVYFRCTSRWGNDII
ncbi:hypothetical protein LCGC14_2057740, partial [marine sediment metagenome]